MDDKAYITTKLIDRVNRSMIRERSLLSGKVYNSSTRSYDVSVNYGGRIISRSISSENVKKAYSRALNNVKNGAKL